jgi:hypothetical protein
MSTRHVSYEEFPVLEKRDQKVAGTLLPHKVLSCYKFGETPSNCVDSALMMIFLATESHAFDVFLSLHYKETATS